MASGFRRAFGFSSFLLRKSQDGSSIHSLKQDRDWGLLQSRFYSPLAYASFIRSNSLLPSGDNFRKASAFSVAGMLQSVVYQRSRGLSSGKKKTMTGEKQKQKQKQVMEERKAKAMERVRGIMKKEEGEGAEKGLGRTGMDMVHIKILRNNTFVTLTDSEGNKKAGASCGSMKTLKGKAYRYASEATANHIGKVSANTGVKSVVVKVNGFTYFKKKKQAILGFKDGYSSSGILHNPILYMEDTTRLPHNGCRLPKRRRI